MYLDVRNHPVTNFAEVRYSPNGAPVAPVQRIPLSQRTRLFPREKSTEIKSSLYVLENVVCYVRKRKSVQQCDCEGEKRGCKEEKLRLARSKAGTAGMSSGGDAYSFSVGTCIICTT